MFSMPCEFEKAKTKVFWDIGDCPIPENLSPSLIYHNIKSALANKGYVGEVSISAYSDKEQDLGDFESSGITLLPTGDKRARRISILEDFMFWAGDEHPKPFNVMLITKDITKDMEYLDCLLFWNEKNGNFLLAQLGNEADNLSELLLHHVTAIWLWESLSLGGKPILEICIRTFGGSIWDPVNRLFGGEMMWEIPEGRGGWDSQAEDINDQSTTSQPVSNTKNIKLGGGEASSSTHRKVSPPEITIPIHNKFDALSL